MTDIPAVEVGYDGAFFDAEMVGINDDADEATGAATTDDEIDASTSEGGHEDDDACATTTPRSTDDIREGAVATWDGGGYAAPPECSTSAAAGDASSTGSSRSPVAPPATVGFSFDPGVAIDSMMADDDPSGLADTFSVRAFAKSASPALAEAYAANDRALGKRDSAMADIQKCRLEIRLLQERIRKRKEEANGRLKVDAGSAAKKVYELELREPCEWNANLRRLKEYVERTGNVTGTLPRPCNVPRDDDRNLVRWAEKIYDDKSRGVNPQNHLPHRLRALRSIGAGHVENAEDEKWTAMLKRMGQFKETHGTTKLPRRKCDKRSLMGEFVDDSLATTDLKEFALDKNPHRMQQAIALGYTADDVTFKNDMDIWLKHLETYKAYIAEYGIRDVWKSRVRDNLKFFDWFRHQKLSVQRGKIDERRREILEKEGMLEHLGKKFEDKWQADFENNTRRLLEFRERNGTVRVPRGDREHTRLQAWLNNTLLKMRTGELPRARFETLRRAGILDEVKMSDAKVRRGGPGRPSKLRKTPEEAVRDYTLIPVENRGRCPKSRRFLCRVAGCDVPSSGGCNLLCKFHFSEFKGVTSVYKKSCKSEGCDKFSQGQKCEGYCHGHYQELYGGRTRKDKVYRSYDSPIHHKYLQGGGDDVDNNEKITSDREEDTDNEFEENADFEPNNGRGSNDVAIMNPLPPVQWIAKG